MKILVCITHVPDTTSKIGFTDANTKFNAAGVQFIIGPYDEYALSKAIDLKEAGGGEITVLNVGTAETEPTLRKALAIGADKAVRVDAFPASAGFVAGQIAAYAKDKSFDLIMMGRESIDFNGGMVHGMVAEMLGIPYVSPVMQLAINGTTASITGEVEGGKQQLEASLPLVLGCQEPIAEWKIPNMRGIMSAKTKPLETLPPVPVNSTLKDMEFELPAPKSACKMVDADNMGELVRLLKQEAKVL